MIQTVNKVNVVIDQSETAIREKVDSTETNLEKDEVESDVNKSEKSGVIKSEKY